MEGNQVHEYFARKPSKWNINSFLDESNDVKSFPDKIGYYLASLEAIIKDEDGERYEKALQLYNQYKQASSRMFLVKIK